MKDVIISEKAKEKMLSKGPPDITALAKVAWASSSINLVWRYIWAISNIDVDAAKKLGLTGVKKYWRYADQVEMELD